MVMPSMTVCRKKGARYKFSNCTTSSKNLTKDLYTVESLPRVYIYFPLNGKLRHRQTAVYTDHKATRCMRATRPGYILLNYIVTHHLSNICSLPFNVNSSWADLNFYFYKNPSNLYRYCIYRTLTFTIIAYNSRFQFILPITGQVVKENCRQIL